jgi:hypothetical protein
MDSFERDLHIINGNRPEEIHTIIAWDGNKHYQETKKYCENLPSNFEILFEKKMELTKRDEDILRNSVYFGDKSRVKNGCLYLVIIKDTNPCYSYEQASACKQVMNKNMKILKEDMRLKIGGSITSCFTIHTSYNTEETLLVLTPFRLDHIIKRPVFKDFNELFDMLNNKPLLKYVIQRSFHEIEEPLNYFKAGHDVDILVNDYYYFKALTGARCHGDNKIKKNMRENDNGFMIQSRINIGGIEIPFDIRFVGDNYVDSNWENDMLNRKVIHTLKNNVQIYIPNTLDELYSVLYHVIIQKPNPSNSKHIPRIQNLIKLSGEPEMDFNNLPQLKYRLDEFLQKNNYEYKRPFDKRAGFFYNKFN